MRSLSHSQEYGYIVEPKKKAKKEGQDLSKIPGVPGHDYPIYHDFPPTNFDCGKMVTHPGIYADVETACQVSVIPVKSTDLF